MQFDTPGNMSVCVYYCICHCRWWQQSGDPFRISVPKTSWFM